MTASSPNPVEALHAKAVKKLVEDHIALKDEPMVLAVRYRLDDPQDIYLLEVLEQFPGPDDDALLETSFGPSATLRIVGDFHLALGNAAQVLSAIQRGDEVVRAARQGQILFDNGSDLAARIKRELGL